MSHRVAALLVQATHSKSEGFAIFTFVIRMARAAGAYAARRGATDGLGDLPFFGYFIPGSECCDVASHID